MVICYDCKGRGYQLFQGHESLCKPCGGEGELVVCNSYTLPPDALMVFRNQKCHHCGVKENDHVNVQVGA